MRNKKLTKSEGFTIIEVLIVLAIAGLIMLIVFLAVPALQRNSHNTQRKSDVSAMTGALQEYVNNNGGQLPASCVGAACASSFLGNAKLGFYKQSDVDFVNNGSAFTTLPATNASHVYVESFAKCASATTLDASPTSRNVAAIYWVEATGGPQVQCSDM